jgi:hypothetical protein
MKMKKMMLVLMGMLFLCIQPVNAENVTFDDLTLDPNTYYNGSDIIGGGEGEFETTGVTFNIYFDNTYGPYWEGFAYSNTTDTTTPDYTNQYSSITGTGADDSSVYGVGYVDGFYGTVPTITFADEVFLAQASITNTTYAFFAMQDGNAPAKKYGGDAGDDPDWYLLTITGKDADEIVTDVVEFYLADFRFSDNSQDYIIDAWTAVDLSSLGQVKTLEFSVSSSDTGDYGINTPTYFAIDNIAIDQCSDDPNKTEPGICDCGISDADTDGDGVADCQDSDDDDGDDDDTTCFVHTIGM